MGLFDFLKPRTTPPVQTAGNGQIPRLVRERTRQLEGRQVFSVIHNGHYFLVNMPIYEDGVVDCWEFVDLATMEKKVRQGWVTPQVPNGEKLSIFHLAEVQVMQGQWLCTQDNYMDFVHSIVQEMNPRMENILEVGQETSKIIGNSNVSRLGSGETILRQDSPKPSFQQYKGNQMSLFYKHRDGTYYLLTLAIYVDGKVLVVGGPESWFLTREEVLKWGARGALHVSVPAGATVVVERLGRFIAGECRAYVTLADKMNEIDDMIAVLNKQPDAADRCATAFECYEKDPTPENRERLRAAYERVPNHLRVYILGDMDAKDWPIREALSLN